MDRKPTYEELEQKVQELERTVLDYEHTEKIFWREKHFTETIIDSLPGMFYFFDDKGKFLRWNKNLEKITGYSPEDISKMNPLDFFIEENKEKVGEKIQEVFTKGRSSVEASIAPKSGKIIPFYLTGLRTVIDNKSYLVGMGMDISERKRVEAALRESEERYRSLMESTEDSIYLVDNDCRYLYINAKHLSRLGQKNKNQILGRTYSDFHSKNDTREFQEKTREVCKKAISIHHEYRSRIDGRYFLRTLSPVKKRLDRVSSVTVVSKDITDLKNAETTLKESLDAIKFFAYSVSHDLKSPAIGAHELTKRLKEHCRDIFDDKANQYCDLIMKASGQILNLVEQINVYISAKEIPLNIECVNFKEVLQILRDEFSSQINIQGIKWVEPEHIPELNLDRLAMIRVMRNLIDNALKYGGDDLRQIRIGYDASEEFHTLSVADDGVGTKEGDSRKLFEVFKRDRSSEGVAGTGLGLAIVKEIAERHRGKVWVEPGKEKGLIFFVDISKYLSIEMR